MQACYQSKAQELVGGYTMRGTNVYKNGSSVPFTVETACVCSCEGTIDGIVCNGTIGAQATHHGTEKDSSSYSLFAWIPDATIAGRRAADPGNWERPAHFHPLVSHSSPSPYFASHFTFMPSTPPQNNGMGVK